MTKPLIKHLKQEIQAIRDAGLYKSERVITSPQAADIELTDGAHVLNFCANNYLGLANDPEIVEAAKQALDDYAIGTASVRFICGTMDIHKELENKISKFHAMDDTILYSSCYAANGGLFETLLGEKDAIISDAMNHASIIDGVRLCKAKRFRYKNNDMEELERCLQEAEGARHIMIVTDGVFSMEGYIANLPHIKELADQYGALLVVDESHATGFMGANGAGATDHFGMRGEVDIITSTLGKALGGSAGGFTTGNKVIIEALRQRSRPYLFSNALPPVIAAAALKVFDILDERGAALRAKLWENAAYFREEMTALGFDIAPGEHAVIPVMLYDAALAAKFADEMLKRGVYVIGFSFPVVPKGHALIRTQMSCAHDRHHLDKAIEAFAEVGRELGVLKEEAA